MIAIQIGERNRDSAERIAFVGSFLMRYFQFLGIFMKQIIPRILIC